MTEMWACTDCGVEVKFDRRHQHMADEHGVMYSAVCGGCHESIESADGETFARVSAAHTKVHRVCPDCTETEPCERAKRLVGVTDATT